jgi:hypothetical protein
MGFNEQLDEGRCAVSSSSKTGVHYDLAGGKCEQRARVLAGAFAKNSERFPNGLPQPKAVPTAVWINPPAHRADLLQAELAVTQEAREPACRHVDRKGRVDNHTGEPGQRLGAARCWT